MTDYQSFSPDLYLNEYYRNLDNENKFLMYNFHEIYNSIVPPSQKLLDIGAGPTVYQLISASKNVDQIEVADFLATNREKIKNWNKWPHWEQYFRFVAQQEQSNNFCQNCIHERLSSKLESIIPVDLKSEQLGGYLTRCSDIVSSVFCFEGISHDMHDAKLFFKRIVGLVKPQGYLIAAVLTECNAYKVADNLFPATYLTNNEIKELCNQNHLLIKHLSSIDAVENRGYGGITILAAQKLGK